MTEAASTARYAVCETAKRVLANMGPVGLLAAWFVRALQSRPCKISQKKERA